MTATPRQHTSSAATPAASRTSTTAFAMSEGAGDQPSEDEPSDPRQHGGDDGNVEVGGAVEAFGEAEEGERRHGAGELERDDGLDLAGTDAAERDAQVDALARPRRLGERGGDGRCAEAPDDHDPVPLADEQQPEHEERDQPEEPARQVWDQPPHAQLVPRPEGRKR